MWTVLGFEFGKDGRMAAVIVRALYGLKSAGAALRCQLARYMESLGYNSFMADLDLCQNKKLGQMMRYTVTPISCVMSMTFFVFTTMQMLFFSYYTNKLNIGNLDMYLGAKLYKTRFHNRVWTWAISPVEYI